MRILLVVTAVGTVACVQRVLPQKNIDVVEEVSNLEGRIVKEPSMRMVWL